MFLKPKKYLVFVLLFFVCLTVYANSLFSDFVFDDLSLVVRNPDIKSFSNTGKIFKKDLFDFAYEGEKPNYYRPIQTLSFMLDYKLWKLNPWGYHLTNIVLHAVNAFLVYLIIYTLFGNALLSVITSLLFCIHPINTSAVAYITGRHDLFAALFMLLTLLCTSLSILNLKKRKTFFMLTLLFTCLSFFSREISLFIPLGVILLSFLLKGEKRYKIALILSTILLVCVYLYFRLVVLNMPIQRASYLSLGLYLKAINFLNIVCHYLLLLIFPVNLYLMHTILPVTSFASPGLWLSLVISLSILIFWYLKRNNKIINFGLAWFLIFILQGFFLMTGFYGKKINMFEHWSYLASIGFYLVIGYLLYGMTLRRKSLAYYFIIVVLATYGFITVRNNSNFKDRITLATRILKFDSDNKEAHKELADLFLEEKKYAQAFKHIEQALKLDSREPDLYLLQGVYYEDIGKPELAIAAYEKILELEPRSGRAYNNIGAVYFNKGELARAELFFKKAIEFNPLLFEPCLNMARIYFARNDFKNAVNVLNHALSIGHKEEMVFVLLGIGNSEMGSYDQAERCFREALKLNPKSEQALLNFGILLANRNQLREAIGVWQQALTNNPHNQAIKQHIINATVLLDKR